MALSTSGHHVFAWGAATAGLELPLDERGEWISDTLHARIDKYGMATGMPEDFRASR